MEHLIISHLHQSNHHKIDEIIDYQHVPWCSMVFRKKVEHTLFSVQTKVSLL